MFSSCILFLSPLEKAMAYFTPVFFQQSFSVNNIGKPSVRAFVQCREGCRGREERQRQKR